MSASQTLAYLASLSVLGEELDKAGQKLLSVPTDGTSIYDFLCTKDALRQGIYDYENVRMMVSKLNVPSQLADEHKALVSALKDLIAGTEMQYDSIQVNESRTGGYCDEVLFNAGQGKQHLSEERTRFALEGMVRKVNDLGLF